MVTILGALVSSVCLPILVGAPVFTEQEKSPPAFAFAGAEYFARFSKGNLHEYTPKGQSDLKKWTDMVTINDYPTVRTGEALATTANSVLETYKKAQAHVVRTDSLSRTDKKPAEHLIVVVFGRPEFMEAAFARFVMNNGVGASVVYSHRIYSKKAGDAMGDWLTKNGENIEKHLMAMPVPKH